MSTLDRGKATEWFVQLADDLAAGDEAVKGLVAGLSEEQLNWQAAPGSWSVGQCLEHLCLMNEVYLPPIRAALAGKPKRRVEQITPGWFGSWFLRNIVEPSPQTKRVEAPKKIRPAQHVGLGVLDRFLKGNQQCREVIERAQEKDVNRIRFWNPFIPGLRFTVGTGLKIICVHEQRHLLQAIRVKDSANFPH